MLSSPAGSNKKGKVVVGIPPRMLKTQQTLTESSWEGRQSLNVQVLKFSFV